MHRTYAIAYRKIDLDEVNLVRRLFKGPGHGGRGGQLCTLLPNGREDVTLTALFPPDCSGSLTVASKTRLRCSDALASARHRQNFYLQGYEPR
jgi:hypothetical protein